LPFGPVTRADASQADATVFGRLEPIAERDIVFRVGRGSRVADRGSRVAGRGSGTIGSENMFCWIPAGAGLGTNFRALALLAVPVTPAHD
jgi:hypothetical protein